MIVCVQDAVTEAPAAVVRHGVTRRATKGMVLLQRAMPAAVVAPAQPISSSAAPAAALNPPGTKSKQVQVFKGQDWSPEAAAMVDRNTGAAVARAGPKPLRTGQQNLGAHGGVQKHRPQPRSGLKVLQSQEQQQQQQQPQKRKQSKKQRQKAAQKNAVGGAKRASI